MRGTVFAAVAAALLGAVLVPAMASADDSNPLAGQKFYVNTNTSESPINQAAIQAVKNPNDANKFVAAVPQSVWLTPDVPTNAIAGVVSKYTAKAAAEGAYPTFVLYAIPERDCGSYSAGGYSRDADYKAWVDQVSAGIGDRKAAVIVEPDALAFPPVQMNGQHYGYCDMTDEQISRRYANIKAAVYSLAAHANTAVYIDAGQTNWWYPGVPVSDYEKFRVDEVVKRLKWAGIEKARGFSLNVSGYASTSAVQAFGEKISAGLGGNKYYVFDTSRNGNGPDAQGNWCNVDGRALGTLPTTNTGAPHNDAMLWIKHPGESDGNCQPGQPYSGYWYQAYVDGLYSRTSDAVKQSLNAPTPTPAPTTPAPTTPAPTTPAPTPTPTPTTNPEPGPVTSSTDPTSPDANWWTSKNSAGSAVWRYSLAVTATKMKIETVSSQCGQGGSTTCDRRLDQYQRRLNIFQARLLAALVAYANL